MAIQAQLYSDNTGFLDSGGNGHVNGGFNRFCFGHQWRQLQVQPQQQQLQIQQPENQGLCFENNGESVLFCQTMVSQVEEQRREIDQFIKSQNERLRLLLQEQRKQQVAAMAEKLESKATLLLSQKDAELVKATNKTMELQNLVNKLEMENQTWRRVAQENEAMVVSLNNTLGQLQQQNLVGCCFNNGVDDAESCCEETEEEEKNRGFVGTKTMMMVCKCCNSRSSCVLFLPCRHLCSCKDCAAFLDCCPVCSTAKKASIEALIS
ncbi:hypothetical protein HRI_004938500 [Hibiscus trionum]|uniref:RING-type domain-containing protein n=1 Tax=Hibiscus trionum TaxID=183268 RepID=A0A9W7JDK8_HIBTR|nr:hypothetical protein HRI_004938500 [Hibiscus trionum]